MLINCHACMHALYYEIPLKSSCALYFRMDGVVVVLKVANGSCFRQEKKC